MAARRTRRSGARGKNDGDGDERAQADGGQVEAGAGKVWAGRARQRAGGASAAAVTHPATVSGQRPASADVSSRLRRPASPPSPRPCDREVTQWHSGPWRRAGKRPHPHGRAVSHFPHGPPVSSTRAVWVRVSREPPAKQHCCRHGQISPCPPLPSAPIRSARPAFRALLTCPIVHAMPFYIGDSVRGTPSQIPALAGPLALSSRQLQGLVSEPPPPIHHTSARKPIRPRTSTSRARSQAFNLAGKALGPGADRAELHRSARASLQAYR